MASQQQEQMSIMDSPDTVAAPEPGGDGRLSYTGDPVDEASVASALAEAAMGGQTPQPWRNDGLPRQTIALGPGLAAMRARRSTEELALVREVAQRIVVYRETHQLSLRDLADQLGMPQPNLARLELGLHTPTLETLARLARILGITFAIEITPAGIRLQPAA